MESRWRHDGVELYTLESRKLGLIVRGFYNSTPPACLIINMSENGPLCHNVINTGDQLVSIKGHAIRSHNNFQLDMGAACQVLGIHIQLVSSYN